MARQNDFQRPGTKLHLKELGADSKFNCYFPFIFKSIESLFADEICKGKKLATSYLDN